MARSRMLIVIALLLILIAVGGGAAWFFLLGPGSAVGPGVEPTPVEVTATPEPLLPVLVAAQDLPRGVVIPTEAISMYPWPTAIVPLNAVTDALQIVNTRAKFDIDRGMPILSSMVVQSLDQLSPSGSDAAAQIPDGQQAITLQYDKRNGVALGIKDGDHVNVIVSMWLVDIDQNFQTVLPNLTMNVRPPSPGDPATGIPAGLVALVVPPTEGGGAEPKPQPFGRGERDATVGQDFYVIPSENQRGRLVTQGIIQDATVLHIGDFVEALFPTLPPPTPTPDPNVTQPPAPLPTDTPAPPDTITLIVSPQDTLVLNYVKELMVQYPGAVQITFTLRSAGDISRQDTESVTMQYMFERFNIAVPSKLNYGLDNSLAAPTPTPVP
ncbi:MAG TPA: SAF domain-containing protein [Anaerolineales bacterium]|nr:SAF domain-containing protein [Anaerolineales bacterium]